MSKFIECPKCLGTGEAVFWLTLKKCSICMGKKTVHPDIAEDFIHSIRIFEDEE